MGTNNLQTNWRDSKRHQQAERALERQLDYQQRKAKFVAGREAEIISAMQRSSKRVRDLLESFKPINESARVIEVGSGAHGLIFYFGGRRGVGVDPLAVSYSALFPWQKCATTVAAFGEQLPFADESFDFVICDNVVDHAESPATIVKELVRILGQAACSTLLSMFITQSTRWRRKHTRLGERLEFRWRLGRSLTTLRT